MLVGVLVGVAVTVGVLVGVTVLVGVGVTVTVGVLVGVGVTWGYSSCFCFICITGAAIFICKVHIGSCLRTVVI